MAEKKKLRIVSDGTASGTQVLVGDVPVPAVKEIVIDPIRPNEQLTATLKIAGPELDVVVETSNKLEGYDRLRQALKKASEGWKVYYVASALTKAFSAALDIADPPKSSANSRTKIIKFESGGSLQILNTEISYLQTAAGAKPPDFVFFNTDEKGSNDQQAE